MDPNKKYAKVTELDGVPKMTEAIPLAFQHVMAMIVGCVTPAIILCGVIGADARYPDHADPGIPYYFRYYNAFTAVSATSDAWFPSSGHHGRQLCIHPPACFPGCQI